jgi:hypothetical protein
MQMYLRLQIGWRDTFKIRLTKISSSRISNSYSNDLNQLYASKWYQSIATYYRHMGNKF